jgi:hypothetical protein
MIQYAPRLDAYGIRFHGRAWLKFTQIAPLGAESYGWRPFSWTTDVNQAEKWGCEAAAREFAERRCHGPFEIAQIRPNQQPEILPA